MGPYATPGEGSQAVVEIPQVQALQVGNVTGDVEPKNPALAVSGHLVGARDATQEQAAPGGTIPPRVPRVEVTRDDTHVSNGSLSDESRPAS